MNKKNSYSVPVLDLSKDKMYYIMSLKVGVQWPDRGECSVIYNL